MRDAEGYDKRGRPNVGKHPNGSLAHLRRSTGSQTRFDGGQDWSLIEAIGHDLNDRHQVERTTAYDTGVSTESPVVVATAALEVGYDDPHVGVVIQHKAPRDVAQFLQRKGRAGRTRHMRPWTIVVLSDYGRDRVAYQAYDRLFDPEVPARTLPLVNRYVRRIQAAYCLIDYLGMKAQVFVPRGSVWRDLSRPSDIDESRLVPIKAQLLDILAELTDPVSSIEWRAAKGRAMKIGQQSGSYVRGEKQQWDPANYIERWRRRAKLSQDLTSLLGNPEELDRFCEFLRRALSLPVGDIAPLLWEHPRPILLGVVPTALRRLSSEWRARGEPRKDIAGGHPIPDFVPATLFSDLNLPEVRIDRIGPNGSTRELGHLPVLQALDELAPGQSFEAIRRRPLAWPDDCRRNDRSSH